MLFDLETHINFQLFSIGKGGDNMSKNINIRNHVCHCTEDCVTIINSYDVAELDLKPFLNELKSKSKFELTVNPICPSTCENCDKCLFAEHVHQIEYSNKQDMLNCPNKKRFLNQDDLISLDMIQTNYLKKGFNKITLKCIGTVIDSSNYGRTPNIDRLDIRF